MLTGLAIMGMALGLGGPCGAQTHAVEAEEKLKANIREKEKILHAAPPSSDKSAAVLLDTGVARRGLEAQDLAIRPEEKFLKLNQRRTVLGGTSQSESAGADAGILKPAPRPAQPGGVAKKDTGPVKEELHCDLPRSAKHKETAKAKSRRKGKPSKPAGEAEPEEDSPSPGEVPVPGTQGRVSFNMRGGVVDEEDPFRTKDPKDKDRIQVMREPPESLKRGCP